MINLLEAYTVIIIEPDGRVIYVTIKSEFIDLISDNLIYISEDDYRDKDGNLNHYLLFPKVEKYIPGLLEHMQNKDKEFNADPFVKCISANKRVIIWPTELASPSDIIVVSLPKLPSNEQCEAVEELLDGFSGIGLFFAGTSEFKDLVSYNIEAKSFETSGEYSETVEMIRAYLNSIKSINNLGKPYNDINELLPSSINLS